ncbi:MAG: hypothetical protein HC912_10455 [Saprospiraceae bacterium]|nr:hypothetical protein [Saprospiraceae bacterium]
MKQVIPTYTLVKKSTVLYFGSKEKLEDNSVPYSIDKSGLQVVRMQHLGNAIAWLKTQHTTYATKSLCILCDFEELVYYNFELLHILQSDRALNKIPVFVHGDQLKETQMQQLKSLGVDDYFHAPIDWKFIDEKVAFWNKYKRELNLPPIILIKHEIPIFLLQKEGLIL